MEVPLYNAAMLCEENQDELNDATAVDCTWHYYNRSAAMGWVFGEERLFFDHLLELSPHSIFYIDKVKLSSDTMSFN